MIYTVTLNPSLDYLVEVNEFAMGKTNRTGSERMFPGGKGINVSLVLKNLGIDSIALGFVGGFTGKEIERMIAEKGLQSDFVTVQDGFSRINFKLKNYDGTEINGMGPEISGEEERKLYEKLENLKEGDVLILSGSIPRGMSKTVYNTMLEMVSNKNILCIVDATGNTLLESLQYHPFLIKPNHHELGEFFGVEINSREEAVPYAKRLQEMGARNVLVSLSGKGAVLAAENGQVYMEEAPKGTLVNAVGAGDSMVAGFLAGWMESRAERLGGRGTEESPYLHAFYMALAAGSASAFSEELAEEEEIRDLYRNTFGRNVQWSR